MTSGCRITQEEAEQRAIDAGFWLKDTYIDKKTKIQYVCQCGNGFMCQPDSIHTHNTKSCGHCNDPQVGDKIHNFTVVNVYTGPACGCKVDVKCNCGNILYRRTWGIFVNVHATTSCGHCKDPKIGDRIHNFIVIGVYPGNRGGCRINAKCYCGNVLYRQRWSVFTKGRIKSCGNCQLKRNGYNTSHIALQLHNMVDPNLLISVHNYKPISKSRIAVDIALLHSTIAIEYDEWYWHGHKQKKDKLRMRKLLRNGWKVLRIKAHGNLPTQQQLDKALFELIMTNAKQRTITLPGWDNGPTRFNTEK